MIVYLAGKITGEDEYREKFERAEGTLMEHGHEVLNPATMPEGMTVRDYMAICTAMLARADAIALLPNWVNSRGAQIEKALAEYMGLKVLYTGGKEDEGRP